MRESVARTHPLGKLCAAYVLPQRGVIKSRTSHVVTNLFVSENPNE